MGTKRPNVYSSCAELLCGQTVLIPSSCSFSLFPPSSAQPRSPSYFSVCVCNLWWSHVRCGVGACTEHVSAPLSSFPPAPSISWTTSPLRMVCLLLLIFCLWFCSVCLLRVSHIREMRRDLNLCIWLNSCNILVSCCVHFPTNESSVSFFMAQWHILLLSNSPAYFVKEPLPATHF